MESTRWFERKFATFEDSGRLPTIIERLEGTTARLKQKLATVGETTAEVQLDGKWSVKEEVGHLADLEPLWLARVENLLQGQEELREADLSNQKTHDANHNARALTELIEEFAELRVKIVETIRGFSDADLERSALHPRLKTPMRVIDLAFFVAEHDDHHLARVSYLLHALNN